MRKRILFLLAHPDDETFGTGGTIARYARSGAEVHLATATRGEAGMVGDPPVTDREHLGEVRAGELMAAAEILGIAQVHFLGFLDGQLANVPREQLVERAVELIRRVRPHVLVGFGPEGVSRHADHKVMCEVALSAFDRSADPTWYPGDGAPLGAPQAVSIRDRAGDLRGVGRPPLRGSAGEAHRLHRHLGAGGDEDPRLPLPQDPGEGHPADPRASRLPGVRAAGNVRPCQDAASRATLARGRPAGGDSGRVIRETTEGATRWT